MKLVSPRQIPVNPYFNLDGDPHDNEFAYVNPVALNNQLIVLANEQLTLAQVRVSAERGITRLKLELRKVERDIEDLEETLLRDEPLSPSEAKSLKTIAAAVARRVKEAGKEAAFATLRQSARAYADEIERASALVARARIYSDTAMNVSDNIKTHLSYVKSEREKSGKPGFYGA